MFYNSSDLKNLITIESVLNFYNVRKVSRNLYYCPLHENGSLKHKPSLAVTNHTVKCMSPKYDCFQGSADIFKIISVYEKKDMKKEFPFILKKACEIAGIYDYENIYNYKTEMELQTTHIKYLSERGISIETARKFKLNSRGNSILYPQTKDNKFIGYKAISIEKVDGERKIYFEKGANSTIWFEPNFKKQTNIVFLEGEMDLLRFYEELKRSKIEESYTLITVTHGAISVPFGIETMVENLEPLSVSILYDNDQAGYIGSLKLAKKLTEKIETVTIYKLPTTKPEKYDLSDYLNEGNRLESIWDLDKVVLSKNDNFMQDEKLFQSNKNLENNVFTLQDIKGDPPEMNWMIENFLLCDKLGAVVANGGVGKSWFLLNLALSIATGKNFLGMKNCLPASNVLYISGEEDKIDIHRRIQALKKTMDLVTDDFSLNLSFLPVTGMNIVMTEKSLIYNYLEDYIAQKAPKLIILDPLVRFFNGDENNSTHMTRFIEILEWFIGKKTTIIFSHHTNKMLSNDLTQNASRGSSAIIDAVRWNLVLSKIKESSGNYFFKNSTEPLDPEDADLYVNAYIAKCNSFNPKRNLFTLKRTQAGPLELLNDVLIKKNDNRNY